MKIQLDCILDNVDNIEEANKELKSLLEDYGINGKVITLNGPAGGNPLIEVEGPDEKVKEFMKDNGYEDLIED